MMTTTAVKTRFAPSPTGYIHMGNARTALFAFLYAKKHQGSFLLRIEDTDKARSEMRFVEALRRDLHWLGVDWDEGPGKGGDHEPYFQSQREDLYETYLQQLQSQGQAYPCFCTPTELEVMRKMQAQAGRPPRYDGRCSLLHVDQVSEKLQAGTPHTIRFKVPKGQEVIFVDEVKGRQRYMSDDIGDFILKKADGSAAFFFSNAIDDALMQVTMALRGEDHLTNTPRQIMILQALGLPIPGYAHMSTIMGMDGKPLSKRNGSASIAELREAGYLPEAVLNQLARLGHHYDNPNLLTLAELIEQFDLAKLGTSPAKYEPAQLDHWQNEALMQLDAERLWQWLLPETRTLVGEAQKERFIAAIKPNITLPADAHAWAKIIYEELPLPEDDFLKGIAPSFFAAAVQAVDKGIGDWKRFVEDVKAETGAKGKNLFMPLRIGITGQSHGPEMDKVFDLIHPQELKRRFHAVMQWLQGANW